MSHTLFKERVVNMVKTVIRRILRKYGNSFREKREVAELTQLEVAKRLHCSQAIISHIEAGLYLPSEKFERELTELYEHI
jgi:ribosome-binding protein aMBF1 (putative translation factor)